MLSIFVARFFLLSSDKLLNSLKVIEFLSVVSFIPSSSDKLLEKLSIIKYIIARLNKKRNGLVYVNRLPCMYSFEIFPGLKISLDSVFLNLESYEIRFAKNSLIRSLKVIFLVLFI